MKIKNEKGSLLILALFVAVLLGGFGTAFILMSSSDSNLARIQRKTSTAFYSAEAGIERALYDLRQDFLMDTTHNWSSGKIHNWQVDRRQSQRDSEGYYLLPYPYNPNQKDYPYTSLRNGGFYTVSLKDVSARGIWIKSVGSFEGATQTIKVYVEIDAISPWHQVITAGSGFQGSAINGSVAIHGSVLVLGDLLSPTDYAINAGGNALVISNNYEGMDEDLRKRVPDLPTTVIDGDTVETLSAKLRVKKGKVNLQGNASVGKENESGNTYKEKVDGCYVTNGFKVNQDRYVEHIFSDNDWGNPYDLADTISLPGLSNPYKGYDTYKEWFYDNALVISEPDELDKLANITPASKFNFTEKELPNEEGGIKIKGPKAKGTISMDGNGKLYVSGMVYIAGGLAMNGGTITYQGKASILVDGDVNIDTNLLTQGDSKSYPKYMVAFMTPKNINLGTLSASSQLDIMGLFYAANKITMAKQTDVVGTVVAKYIDMGGQVPKIYQVPSTVDNLPPGLVGSDFDWQMKIISWQNI